MPFPCLTSVPTNHSPRYWFPSSISVSGLDSTSGALSGSGPKSNFPSSSIILRVLSSSLKSSSVGFSSLGSSTFASSLDSSSTASLDFYGEFFKSSESRGLIAKVPDFTSDTCEFLIETEFLSDFFGDSCGLFGVSIFSNGASGDSFGFSGVWIEISSDVLRESLFSSDFLWVSCTFSGVFWSLFGENYNSYSFLVKNESELPTTDSRILEIVECYFDILIFCADSIPI